MARPRKADRRAEPALAVCDDAIVHLDAVQAARSAVPGAPIVGGVADVFAALGDPTRLRVVAALAARELCVCDLAATLGLTQSAVSHQLRLLRDLGVVRPRRAGRLVYYALDDAHVVGLVGLAIEHVTHTMTEDAS